MVTFNPYSKEWQAIKGKLIEFEKQAYDALSNAKDWESCARAQEKLAICKTILSWENDA